MRVVCVSSPDSIASQSTTMNDGGVVCGREVSSICGAVEHEDGEAVQVEYVHRQ